MDRVVCACAGRYVVVRVWPPLLTPTTLTRGVRVCVLWLVVGLGVDRIVDALRMLTVLTPGFPRTHVHGACVWWWGVVVCVGLLVPVSSQTVAGLPLLAYQPSSLLGAYQEGQVLLVETLS